MTISPNETPIDSDGDGVDSSQIEDLSKDHLESKTHQDKTIQSQDDAELMLNMSAPAGVDSD